MTFVKHQWEEDPHLAPIKGCVNCTEVWEPYNPEPQSSCSQHKDPVFFHNWVDDHFMGNRRCTNCPEVWWPGDAAPPPGTQCLPPKASVA